jgi:acyl-CoA synthetase (AMP-forming)/AMP-acid ligase II
MPEPDFRTLVDILRYRAQAQPDRLTYTFLSNRGQQTAKLTYRELYQRASGIASALQTMGAGGERVLLFFPPGLDYISAFLGCLLAGGIAVPCYPPHRNKPNTQLIGIQADSQASVALTTAHILENLHEYFPASYHWQDLRWLAADTLAGMDEMGLGCSSAADGLAFLQYTSGSTAAPKGVMVSHANLMYSLQAIQDCFEHTPESRGVIWLPPYHDMGLVGGILQPLYVGFPVTLLPPVDFVSFPFLWLQTISQVRATVSGGPNFAYDLCIRSITPDQKAMLDLSSWQLAFNGAESVRSDVLERFHQAFEPCGFRRDAFLPCYGLAEATIIVSGGRRVNRPIVQRYDRQALQEGRICAAPSENDGVPLVGCGQCVPGQEIVIANPDSGERCPPDRVGEIWVRGSGVAQGYWGQPQETVKTFGASLADGNGERYLRTGDLGFLQGDELFVAGRIKELIIIQGRNYYPQDIELTVEQSHPALQPGSGAAFSLETNTGEQVVIVYELKLAFRKANVEEIAQAMRAAVMTHWGLAVSQVWLVRPAQIPKTSSGKIQRHRCRAMLLDGSLKVIGSSILADELPRL